MVKLRESIISRRRFLGGILLGEAASAVVAMSYPLVRFLFHKVQLPLPRQIAISMESLQKMPNNSARYFKYGWMPAIMVRRSGGEYSAFNATCTHLDCTVMYMPDKKNFLCNCHQGIFDLDGVNIEGPPPRPLEKLTLRIEGERMIIFRNQEEAVEKDIT